MTRKDEVAETPTLDLSAAARLLLAAWDRAPEDRFGEAEYAAMERMWWGLTGTDDTDDALALARTFAAHPTTAHVAPF